MTTITVKVNQKPYFDLVAFVQCYKLHLDINKKYNIGFNNALGFFFFKYHFKFHKF